MTVGENAGWTTDGTTDGLVDEVAEGLGELTACPECSAPAEVTEVVILGSTDGPVDHARVRCVRKHWFFMPADRLVRLETSEPARWNVTR
jgi:hypothetical protein